MFLCILYFKCFKKHSYDLLPETIIAERENAWQKRRHSFTKRNNDKIKRNVTEITAQDLLGKSHEELVLLLIHLRRQSVALTEAVDASKAEVENFANAAANRYANKFFNFSCQCCQSSTGNC